MNNGGPAEDELSLDDQARLKATLALDILDTGPEPAFEDAVSMAATICGTPISAVTFLDSKRQWFKARVGLDVSETPREQSFCAHVAREEGLFVVRDALLDNRFKNNPLVTGDPKIRFYAGMPLNSPEGLGIGSLCVIDTVPRELSREQEAALGLLSRQVSTQLKLRAEMKTLSQTLVDKTQLQEELSGSNALFQAFMDNSPLIGYMKDHEGRLIYYNRLFAERFQITREEWIGKNDFEIWPPAYASRYRASDVAVLNNGALVVHEETTPGPDRTTIYWRNYKFPFVDASGERYLAGLSLDTSLDKEAEIAMKRSYQQAHGATERLRDLALTDPSTGLSNRRGFDEQVQKAAMVASHYRFDLSLLLVFVDNHGPSNGAFDEDENDEPLVAVAGLLENAGRASDMVFRYADEQIALLLPNTGIAGAFSFAQRIQRTIAAAPWKHGPVKVSIGVAGNAAGPADAAALVDRAGLALQSACEPGSDRIAVYSANLEPLLQKAG